ncbi:MAG: glycine cleavage system aminomethyltransferase GcvT [Actinomycetales bacterium]|nr:glycine cleavage system aminomethyltransferase GcvT [Actinomycetales bacterium]
MLNVPLNDVHLNLGAKMCPFAGYQMPIEYPTGTVAEHNAVRSAVGVFDVSHMGKVWVTGSGAADFLNSVLVNDLDRIANGQAQYSLLCNESGGVIDDLIVYRVSDDEVRIVPNAANSAEVVRELKDHAPAEITVTDRQTELGILAVQGPKSLQVLHGIGLDVALNYMEFQVSAWQATELTVCRTGYTGEHGYELIAPNAILIELWSALLSAGEPFGLLPCGLGSRDTLRTEMGYPLHGQDISPEISPINAKLGWAIVWNKENFLGKSALLELKLKAAEKNAEVRTLVGLKTLERGVPRPHMQVLRGDDLVGETTSGTFSPTLQLGIALALVDPNIAIGDQLAIDVRGRRLSVEVVQLPFVPTNVR